jgi:hypothetical protein
MPKLNRFNIRIETGDRGTPGPVLFNINNHVLPFENAEGGTAPGEVFSGGFEINSFAHTLALVGPKEGAWQIRAMTVDFVCESAPPYSVRFGAVTLDETTEVNLWQDPPIPAFDV